MIDPPTADIDLKNVVDSPMITDDPADAMIVRACVVASAMLAVDPATAAIVALKTLTVEIVATDDAVIAIDRPNVATRAREARDKAVADIERTKVATDETITDDPAETAIERENVDILDSDAIAVEAAEMEMAWIVLIARVATPAEVAAIDCVNVVVKMSMLNSIQPTPALVCVSSSGKSESSVGSPNWHDASGVVPDASEWPTATTILSPSRAATEVKVSPSANVLFRCVMLLIYSVAGPY